MCKYKKRGKCIQKEDRGTGKTEGRRWKFNICNVSQKGTGIEQIGVTHESVREGKMTELDNRSMTTKSPRLVGNVTKIDSNLGYKVNGKSIEMN